MHLHTDPNGESAVTVTTYVRVLYPAPAPTSSPCADCDGQGITGDHYTMPAADGTAHLIDVFCGTCKGCGSATHDECKLGVHHDDELEDLAELADCVSCDGREWIPVDGWNASAPDADLTIMRIPCGCTGARAELVDDPDE